MTLKTMIDGALTIAEAAERVGLPFHLFDAIGRMNGSEPQALEYASDGKFKLRLANGTFISFTISKAGEMTITEVAPGRAA